MRIVHVVTLVSPDGAFGGPLRVALNQVAELRLRGHDAVVVAGYRGPRPQPTQVDGVPVHLFPVSRVLPGGFSGLVAPGLLRWLRDELPSIDVLHVHAGRDLVTLPAIALAHRAQRPVVTQTHGMITPDRRLVARMLDAGLTRRLLRRAAARLVLTEREEAELARVLAPGSHPTQRLPNGVPNPTCTPDTSTAQDVLFLARLHVRKRPAAFVRSAIALGDAFPAARWSLVGPDEGELAAVEALINEAGLAGQVTYEGALDYSAVAGRLARASIYVLPSVDEPFPMSLLEALRAGVPSICTTTCGIAPELASREAALVIGESEDELVAGLHRLLTDSDLRARLSGNAQQAVRDLFSITAVTDELEQIYSTTSLPGR